MGQAALEAGVNAVLTFLEAEFTGEDVTRLSAPPGGRLPADAVYFQLSNDSGLVGTVGATADFLQGTSTTDLVERLHLDDLPGAVRKAGAGQCVMLAAGKLPAAVPLA